MDRRRKGRWMRREGDEEGRGGVGRRGEEGGGSRGGREELEWTDSVYRKDHVPFDF